MTEDKKFVARRAVLIKGLNHEISELALLNLLDELEKRLSALEKRLHVSKTAE